jgi:hypothetical protein
MVENFKRLVLDKITDPLAKKSNKIQTDKNPLSEDYIGLIIENY